MIMIKLGGGALNAIYPINSVIVTSTNENPSVTLGGSWQLIDKEFKAKTGTLGGFNETSNVSNNAVRYSRNGHSIYIEFNITNAVAITDSTLTLGNLDLNELGISRFVHSMRYVGASDGGNAAIQFYINALTGEVQTLDVFGENSIAANNTCYFFASISLNYQYMLDSTCDKFYWKRTA